MWQLVGPSTSTVGNFESAEYVVLLGDVGSGKSTVVEKLTGEKGRSSESSISYTRTSEAFCVPDGSLVISDTPASNAMDYQLEHNVRIAAAFNYKLVSRLFIVAKAENRKENRCYQQHKQIRQSFSGTCRIGRIGGTCYTHGYCKMDGRRTYTRRRTKAWYRHGCLLQQAHPGRDPVERHTEDLHKEA